MNLDRFSVPTANELKHSKEFYRKFQEEQETEVKTCRGCNLEIDITEEYVESEIYGEEYIHKLDECIIAYYTKENAKDLLGTSKSLSKVI